MPLEAWLPRRSRKFEPRLSALLPADWLALVDVAPGVGDGAGEGDGEGKGDGEGDGDGDGVGVGVGVGVGDEVGVEVGVGVCAKAAVAGNIATAASVMTIAVAIRRTRSSPIVGRIPVGCCVQHMTTNPETKWRPAKIQHARRAGATICAELPRGVNRSACFRRGDCLQLWFRCHSSQIAAGHLRCGLEICAQLASARFSCWNIVHNRNWPLGCAFRDRLKTRTDFRKPVCDVAREKRPRLFYI